MAHPRHPLTGRQFAVRAQSARELGAYLHRIDQLRQELRLGMTSPADVDRALRRMRFGAVTLERAARSYAARVELADNTRRRALSVLAGPLRALAAEDLDALDGARLAVHFDRLARRMAHSSLETVWRTLRAIVRHAAERGWTARVPWGSWRPRRLGRAGRPSRECARSPAELARLLAQAASLDAAGGPYRALEAKIACGALLGLRQGELAGLEWRDLNEDAGEVTIARQYAGRPPKGRGLRSADVLEASPALFAVLARHGEHHAGVHERDPIFPAPGGGHYARGECLSTADLRLVASRAGLLNTNTVWSVHSLRDTFTTLEAQQHRGDLVALARRTRHRSLASLVRYLRSFERGHAGARAPLALPA